MKMIPILQVTLPLKSLQRIAPSRFFQLTNCALREVWNADKAVGHLLPRSPQSKLGSLIHNLLEQVIRGDINDLITIEAKWEEELELWEKQTQTVWFEKHFVPLRPRIPEFEVKKYQLLNAATKIITQRKVGDNKRQRTRRSGVWIQSQDEIVGGFIDEIRHLKTGVQIIDYKTGVILDTDNNGIKPEYLMQIRLYAALYYENYRQWPERLSIIKLNNVEIDLPFTESDCLRLLEDAKTIFKETNKLISEEGQPGQLANPSEVNCRFCSYRPACSSYLSQMNTFSAQWTYVDLKGEILDLQTLGNGKLRLLLNIGDREVFIRGISAERHPIFSSMQISKIKIFNISRDFNKNTYIENEYTTIYG